MRKRLRFISSVQKNPRRLSQSDVKRIDGREISANEFETIRKSDRPVILTGAVDVSTLQASTVPLGPEIFTASFGHLDELASNGHFGATRSSQLFNVASLLSSDVSEFKFFHTGTSELHRQVLNQSKAILPSFVDDFAIRPVLSVGPKAATSSFHDHDETWFALLAGKKAWWLGDQASSKKLSDADPLVLPEAGKSQSGIQFFVQKPGDLVYLPQGVPHATCNLDAFNFGLGGQGHMETWPAVPRAANKGDLDAVQRLVTSGEDLHATNPYGETALDRAIFVGDLAMAKLLLEERADPNKLEPGLTPLHIAVAKYSGDSSSGKMTNHVKDGAGSEHIVEALLLHRANPNAIDAEHGQSPVHVAAEYGNLGLAKALVQSGGDGHAPAANGAQPFHFAVMGGHLSMVEWFVEELHVDLNAATHEGHTAAHYAAGFDHVKILHYVQRFGADLERKDANGATPLEIAEAEGNKAAVAYLGRKRGKTKSRTGKRKTNAGSGKKAS